MKKLSILAASAAIAVAAAAPVAAQEANDPFVSTQVSTVPALAIIGGLAVIIAIAAADSTD
jgi:hypothetical protein